MKDGKLFGKRAGVNQILPHCHKWAWDMYRQGKNNNWNPEDIPMNRDIKNWNDGTLSDDEKLLVMRCLGFFAGTESLVGNNLVSLFHYITDPECRQYMGRQMWEEMLHNDVIVYICDSLKLDIYEVFEAYKNIPSIRAKDDWLMSVTGNINNLTLDTTTTEGRQAVCRTGFLYWVVCEGIFFYSGFAMLLSLKDKIPGIGEQIEYILRDESLHIQFGANIMNIIQQQYSDVWTPEFQEELTGIIKDAVQLEINYAHDVLPRGILGLNADMFLDYMEYIGNRRLEITNLEYRFDSDHNPFDFLTEAQDLEKSKNFFETRVTEYQQAGALSDDF